MTDSPYPLRQGTWEDVAAIVLQDGASFGFYFSDENMTDVLGYLDPERFVVATDEDRMVGVSGEYTLDFATPGGRTVDLAAITWVSVAPTHRRRGILRSMIEHQLRGYAAQGVPAAALTASEGGIYGRFGFGTATQIRRIEIPRARARLREPGDATSVRLSTADEARKAMPEIHERWRRQLPAGVARIDARWDRLVADRPDARHGRSPLFYLLHADGYVAYRAETSFHDGHFAHTAHIEDYAAATEAAHAALWQTLLDLDLYSTIATNQIPADDPIEHRLIDSRQVQTRGIFDGVWVRPIDVPALVDSRTYAGEFDVVWELHDSLFGDGRYRIAGGPGGVTCVRTDTTPDLVSDISVLGAAFFGGTRLQALAAGGRLHAEDAALLQRADRAWQADRQPFHGTYF